MLNKSTIIFIFTLVIPWICQGEEKKQMTRDEVIQKLPYSTEGDSPGEVENFLSLIDAGESAYPALAEELVNTSDALVAGNIAAIFVKSKGDKSIPLQAMTRYLEIHAREVPVSGGIYSIIRAVGVLGGPKEAAALYELINLDDVLARQAAEHSLKQIKDRQRAAVRLATSSARSNNRTNIEDSKLADEEIEQANKYRKFLLVLRNYWGLLVAGTLIVIIFLLPWILRPFLKKQSGS